MENDKLLGLTVSPGLTVRQAMHSLHETAEKTLIVVDPEGKLIGSLTDGDIRRHILAGGDLDIHIGQVYNHSPLHLFEDYDAAEAKKTMLSRKIGCLPITDAAKVVKGVLLWENLFSDQAKPFTRIEVPVVIMAGGKGSRLEPFTRILPKPLIPIGDKPIIEMIMDNFGAYGCTDFFLTVNYKGEMIRSYFESMNTKYRIQYVWEKTPLGTIGSVKLIEGMQGETFMLSNCDILVNTDYSELLSYHHKQGNDITLVGSMKNYVIPYGVVKLGEGGRFDRIEEKPQFDLLVNTGLYVLQKSVIGLIPAGEKFDITDLIEKIRKSGGKVGVFPVSEKSWGDIGQWEEYQKTMRFFSHLG